MHSIVAENVREYIHPNPEIRTYFDRLVKANKKLFLVTNSPYHFVSVKFSINLESIEICLHNDNNNFSF